MIEILIIIIILSTISSMSMIHQSKTKGESDERFAPQVVNKFLYGASVLFGSLGVLIGIYAFKYQKENVKLIGFSMIMAIIQSALVIMLI